MGYDFKKFYGLGLQMLLHSAKGSTWEKHKYIKRINGTYYYPDNYEGGRHLSSDSKTDDNDPPLIETDEDGRLSDSDVEKLAREVIRGNFGDGEVRKSLLGEFYQQIQDLVNKIYREKASTTKISEVSKEDVETGEKIINNVLSNSAPSTTKGLDYETIFSVYRKK